MNISSIHNKLVTKYMTQRNEELDTGNKYSVCPNHIGNLELILAYNSIPVFLMRQWIVTLNYSSSYSKNLDVDIRRLCRAIQSKCIVFLLPHN